MAINEPQERWSCQKLLMCKIFETFSVCRENDYFVENFITSHTFGKLFVMKCLKTNQK